MGANFAKIKNSFEDSSGNDLIFALKQTKTF